MRRLCVLHGRWTDIVHTFRPWAGHLMQDCTVPDASSMSSTQPFVPARRVIAFIVKTGAAFDSSSARHASSSNGISLFGEQRPYPVQSPCGNTDCPWHKLFYCGAAQRSAGQKLSAEPAHPVSGENQGEIASQMALSSRGDRIANGVAFATGASCTLLQHSQKTTLNRL